MANPQTPRQKSRPPFQKHTSSTSAPTISTSTTSITTPPKPSSLTSHSHSRVSSISPSTITAKMRTLWANSHTKLFTNLNINLKKITPTNPSIPFNHPNPPSSSPNGLPEKCSHTHPSDPLSGPTTRHAEYLHSRVNKGLLAPECYITPPPSSPLSESLSSPSFNSGSPLEYRSRKSIVMHDTDTKTDTETEKTSPYAWRTLQRSCKDILDNINTHINTQISTNTNTNLNISKCDGRITGQENGNRPRTYTGIVDGDGYYIYTKGRYGCDGTQEGGGIRTKSQESIVEVFCDGDEYRSSPPSSCTSTFPKEQQQQVQNQKQKPSTLGKSFAHQIKLPTLISRPLAYLNELQLQVRNPNPGLNSNYSSSAKHREESIRRARISKEFEDAVNGCICSYGKFQNYGGYGDVYRHGQEGKEMGRGVVVRDFAYMEMRPKVRGYGDLESFGKSVGDKGGEKGAMDEGKGEGAGNEGDDDCESRYARSGLDLEDSRYGDEDGYEDEGEEIDYDTEKPVPVEFEKMGTDTSAAITTTNTTLTHPRNIYNFNSNCNSPPLPSSSNPYPSLSPTSQALIHVPHPINPEAINPLISTPTSTSYLSLSLSLSSSLMDSTYLRGSEMQDHLLGCSLCSLGLELGESFSEGDFLFREGDDVDADADADADADIDCAEGTVGRSMDEKYEDHDISIKPNGKENPPTEKDKTEKTLPAPEAETETETKTQFQLSPYTFPGTNLYLYEQVPLPLPMPICRYQSKSISVSKTTSQLLSLKSSEPAESLSHSPESNCNRADDTMEPHCISDTQSQSNTPSRGETEMGTGTTYLEESERAERYEQGSEGYEGYEIYRADEEYERYEGPRKNQGRKSIMMHFSRSPTGCEGGLERNGGLKG